MASTDVTIVTFGNGMHAAHATGCRDLGQARNRTCNGAQETLTVASRAELICELYFGFESLEEDPTNWRGTATEQGFKFHGCLSALPDETPAAEVEAPVEAPVVVQGARVRSAEGVRGQVLEVGMRAGVVVAAVAFGMLLVWVKVVELAAA